jgi:predicted ATP-grasp superfamily ATP-dependent carboligase
MNYKNKKLLILGGNPETIELVQKAKENGIYTIVLDPNPNSPAKVYADKKVNIDGLDTKAILTWIKENPIDGIMVGVADILVKSYHYIGKSLNLPVYTNDDINEVFSYKNKFKTKLREFGLNGIPEFSIDYPELIQFPVIVKPVDNGGGVGITSASNLTELQNSIKIALANSKSKTYIIERFMKCDDSGIYITIQNGKFYSSLVYDRYTSKEQKGKSNVCLGGVYPSKYINLYFSKVEPKLRKMLHSLKVKDGILMLSAFIENNEYYFYDVGFRLQGEAPQIILKNINHFDQVQMLVDFALNGKFGLESIANKNDPLLHGSYAATIWFLAKEGKIKSIQGLSKIQKLPNMIEIRQRLFDGDEVSASMVGNEKQVVMRVYIKGKSKEELINTYNHVVNNLKVIDNNNQSLLLQNFKIEEKL